MFRVRARAAQAPGSSIRNVVPPPVSPAARAIDPPCAAIIRFASANPRPDPPVRPVTSGSKMRGAISAGTPGPSSCTSRITRPLWLLARVVIAGERGEETQIALSYSAWSTRATSPGVSAHPQVGGRDEVVPRSCAGIHLRPRGDHDLGHENGSRIRRLAAREGHEVVHDREGEACVSLDLLYVGEGP